MVHVQSDSGTFIPGTCKHLLSSALMYATNYGTVKKIVQLMSIFELHIE